MHISLPLGSISRWPRRCYCYFKTGVKVEGRAWLCERVHPPISFVGQPEGQPHNPGLQHVDVELRFWNRRNRRISVIGIDDARIPSFRVELTDVTWKAFKTLTLEPGDAPQESYFILVPKLAPYTRVEAATGAKLELEFRPSGGSERWARPTFSGRLGIARSDDRLG